MRSAVELKHEVGTLIDITAQNLYVRAKIESAVRYEVLRLLDIVRAEVKGATSTLYMRTLEAVAQLVLDDLAEGRYDA